MRSVGIENQDYKVIRRGFFRKRHYVLCKSTGAEVRTNPSAMAVYAQMLKAADSLCDTDEEIIMVFSLATQIMGDMSFARSTDIAQFADQQPVEAIRFALQGFRS